MGKYDACIIFTKSNCNLGIIVIARFTATKKYSDLAIHGELKIFNLSILLSKCTMQIVRYLIKENYTAN